MMWLDLIPKWLLAALVVALAATSCKFKYDNTGLSIEIEKGKTYVAQLETGIAKSNKMAAEQVAANESKARAAEQTRRAREQSLLADAGRAKSELELLRVSVQSASGYSLRPTTTIGGPSVDYPDPFAELFLTCSQRYTDLAAIADGHANDVQTLEAAWPK